MRHRKLVHQRRRRVLQPQKGVRITDWIYVGDVFRLIAYLVFVTAAFREIGTYWKTQNQLAVLEERQRLARDLHDGLAQELAYIMRHAMRLSDSDGSARRIREAARRALAESRHAIHALSTASGSLDEAIADAVARSAGRTHIAVDLDLDPGVAAEADQPEALARIAAEAVANAGQHADVDEVRVRARCRATPAATDQRHRPWLRPPSSRPGRTEVSAWTT